VCGGGGGWERWGWCASRAARAVPPRLQVARCHDAVTTSVTIIIITGGVGGGGARVGCLILIIRCCSCWICNVTHVRFLFCKVLCNKKTDGWMEATQASQKNTKALPLPPHQQSPKSREHSYHTIDGSESINRAPIAQFGLERRIFWKVKKHIVSASMALSASLPPCVSTRTRRPALPLQNTTYTARIQYIDTMLSLWHPHSCQSSLSVDLRSAETKAPGTDQAVAGGFCFKPSLVPYCCCFRSHDASATSLYTIPVRTPCLILQKRGMVGFEAEICKSRMAHSPPPCLPWQLQGIQ